MVRDQKIEQRRVENRRSVELLASDRGPDNRENARSNHRPNSKSGERDRAQGLLQFSLRLLRVRDQLIDGLATEQLIVRGARTACVRFRNRRNLSQGRRLQKSRHLAL